LHIEARKITGPASSAPAASSAPDSPEARHAKALELIEDATTPETLAMYAKNAKALLAAKVFSEFQAQQLVVYAELLSRVMGAETAQTIQSINNEVELSETNTLLTLPMADVVRHRAMMRQQWIEAVERVAANETFAEV